jgi:hypothetical protein
VHGHLALGASVVSGQRRIQVEVTAKELAAIQAKGKEAKAKMDRLVPGDPEFDKARAEAIRARILELAAKDVYSRRSTTDIAAQVRQAFVDRPSVHAVRRALHDWNDRGLGALVPKRAGRPKDRQTEVEIVSELRVLHDDFPDAGPTELSSLLLERYGRRLSVSRVHPYLRKASIHFRKPKRPSSR